jgi:hypothetical protein
MIYLRGNGEREGREKLIENNNDESEEFDNKIGAFF